MNYLSLSYFLTVCSEMNITRAAKKLYITQQTLSEHISRLENEYNVKLFVRTPQLQLTYAGEQMKNLAERVMSLNSEIENEMSDIAEQRKGSLSIGIRPTSSRMLLPRILQKFHSQYPYIALHVAVEHSAELIEKTMKGQLDLAIVSGRSVQNHSSRLESEVLLEDYHCMIVPENILTEHFHMRGTDLENGAALNYSLLQDIPMIMTESGKTTRTATDQFLHEHGVEQPKILMEARDMETNFLICAEGVGVTFSYNMYFRHFTKNRKTRYPLYAIPINPPNGAPSTVMLRCVDHYCSSAAKNFMEICRQAADLV